MCTHSLPISSARVYGAGIDEVVVVSLEDVTAAVLRDDAMQHDRVEQLAVVRDDLPDPVARRGRTIARSPVWNRGSMLIPWVTTYVVDPPIREGAKYHHATAARAMIATVVRPERSRGRVTVAVHVAVPAERGGGERGHNARALPLPLSR